MKSFRYRYLTWFLTFLLAMSGVSTACAEQPLDIQSKSAILMDDGTGTVLYEKNSHEKLQIASVTKIMTILLTLEEIEWKK